MNIKKSIILSYNSRSICLFSGSKPGYKRLLPIAVPSIFPWSQARGETVTNRKDRAQARASKKLELEQICREDLECSFNEPLECCEETIDSSEFTATPIFEEEFTFTNSTTQTDETPMFSVKKFSTMS